MGWGYTPGELIGKSVFEFIKSGEQTPDTLFTQISPTASELSLLTKNGDVISVDWIIQWQVIEQLFYCVARVNEVKQNLTQKLLQTEKRLKRVMHMSKIGSWERDFRTGEVYACEKVYELFGILKTGQCGIELEDFFELVHAEDRERVLNFYQNLANEDLIDIEHRLIRPDGKTVVLHQVGSVEKDTKGNVVFISGTVQDITALKEKEEALRLANQRYECIAKATHDVVWDWELTTNKIWWNANFFVQFGYHPEETLEFWLETVHPDDRARILAEVKMAMEQKKQVWVGEYRIQKTDGSYFFVFDRAFIAYDLHGTPVRMIGSVLDITEQKLAEKKLVDNNRKLRNLSGYLRITQEKEKATTASLLHEELAQQLVRVKSDITQLSALLDSPSDLIKYKFERTFHLLNSIIELTRNLSYDIYPEMLTDLGIIETLVWYNNSFNAENKTKISFTTDLTALALTESFNINLFRLYQDCCVFLHTNFEASSITSSLQKIKNELKLRFSCPALDTKLPLSSYNEKLDWLNISERVRFIGGEIDFRSNDHYAITIVFHLSPNMQATN